MELMDRQLTDQDVRLAVYEWVSMTKDCSQQFKDTVTIFKFPSIYKLFTNRRFHRNNAENVYSLSLTNKLLVITTRSEFYFSDVKRDESYGMTHTGMTHTV